ncbi:MAG: hypothetical protein QM754_08085 [Tepidisphaeraceae bacterium]
MKAAFWRARFKITGDVPLSILLAGKSDVVANGPKGLRIVALRPATMP